MPKSAIGWILEATFAVQVSQYVVKQMNVSDYILIKYRLKFLKLHSSTSKTDVIQIGLFASSKNERGGVNVILKYKREKTYQTMFGALFQYLV